MDSTTNDRRLEILKLEGNGLEPSEIVKELSAKYDVTQRMIYKDFETRHSWQPQLQEMEKALLKVRNRHEQLYRKAVIAYIEAKGDRAKIAALNLMRQINVELAQFAGAKSQDQKEPEEICITWQDPKAFEKSDKQA